jgi:hypothetical protein
MSGYTALRFDKLSALAGGATAAARGKRASRFRTSCNWSGAVTPIARLPPSPEGAARRLDEMCPSSTSITFANGDISDLATPREVLLVRKLGTFSC